MRNHGFLRVAAAAPLVRVADCRFNVERILGVLVRAALDGVDVVVFPELSVTGYTCGDLFQHRPLLDAAVEALDHLALQADQVYHGLAIVGLPVVYQDQLYNCAAVLQHGAVLGVVPKSFVPNYKEFYERRWFKPAAGVPSGFVRLTGEPVPFGTDLLFTCGEATIGVEICEDLWVPAPPSCRQALAGANVLVNLSASNDLIGKAAYRRQLVENQSGRCIAAYAYASCGVGESTTDVVFGGHCLIAENGTLLSESSRFERADVLLVADVDLERLQADRLRINSFGDAQPAKRWQRVGFTLPAAAPPGPLRRSVDGHPFVPRGQEKLRERCEEIFHLQVAGLAKRLEHLGMPEVCIGVSGGLDSTLALLVACKTMDLLGQGRERVRGYSLPGFGTTARTRQNAMTLMRQLGVAAAEIDVRELCLEEMRALGHAPFGIDLTGQTVESFTSELRRLPPERRQDLTFENVQARMRMNLLLNAGFVVGTSDVSELALGWTTYCGDHVSMYNPNVSIPKTLVKFLVQWAADHEFTGEAQRALRDVVATRISPELLPTDEHGATHHATEDVIGPYELHDFFLFYFLRYGFSPEKILFLAEEARFDGTYEAGALRHWLSIFVERFFANQFKRSCLPDGPKVGSVSLSPRGDWRMPSDAVAEAWLRFARGQNGG